MIEGLVDQPQSLGARRPPFAGGAIGGGQQTDRTQLSRSMLGRGAGRGSLASRDNSQPSSREPRGGGGYAGTLAGGSTTPPLPAAEMHKKEENEGDARESGTAGEGAASMEGSAGKEDDAAVSKEKKELEEKKMLAILEILSDEGKQKPNSERIRQVFRLLVKVGVERTHADVRNPERQYVGQVLCRCLQRNDIKEHALRGVADYCTDVVETELWEDYCRIWEYIAEVISWSIMCEVRHFEGPRPSLGDFKAAFRSADADIRDPSPLLVHVLKRLVSSAGMAFDEIKDLHSDSLIAELKSRQLSISPDKNLYQLLLN
ncbi:unnamed protein product [Gongylonema pulchrum]|uniref:MI domain-containing protein n=1 Tax=Gongylonema pulchrum TaxID=637853 RepID=A0A183EKM5_9BILA|nr:unnamed protein product [Gongylonema pulchrum]